MGAVALVGWLLCALCECCWCVVSVAGHQAVAEVLLQNGANVNAKQENEATALMRAAAFGLCVVVVLSLLSLCVEVVAQGGCGAGRTPYVFTCLLCYMAGVRCASIGDSSCCALEEELSAFVEQLVFLVVCAHGRCWNVCAVAGRWGFVLVVCFCRAHVFVR